VPLIVDYAEVFSRSRQGFSRAFITTSRVLGFRMKRGGANTASVGMDLCLRSLTFSEAPAEMQISLTLSINPILLIVK